MMTDNRRDGSSPNSINQRKRIQQEKTTSNIYKYGASTTNRLTPGRDQQQYNNNNYNQRYATSTSTSTEDSDVNYDSEQHQTTTSHITQRAIANPKTTIRPPSTSTSSTQHQTTTTTTKIEYGDRKAQQQQRQHSNTSTTTTTTEGFIGKIKRWISMISYPSMWSNLNILSYFNFKGLENTKLWKILVIIFLSLIILSAAVILKNPNSISILTPSYNSSSSSSTPTITTVTEKTVYIEKEIKKEQIFELISEYFSNNLNKKIQDIEIDLKELSKNINGKSNIGDLNQLKDRVDQVKREMIGIDEIKSLVTQSQDKEQLFQQVSDDIRKLANEKVQEINRLSILKIGELENESKKLISDQSKLIESINKEYDIKTQSLRDLSKVIIQDQRDKIEKLKDELSQHSTENKKVLVQEFNQISSKLETLNHQISENLKKDARVFIDSQKGELDRNLQGNIEKGTEQLNSILQGLSSQVNDINIFINKNPDIHSLKVSISSLEGLKSLIDDALEIYSADKIAKPDYALLDAGGSIECRADHYRISTTYPQDPVDRNVITHVLSWFLPSDRPNPPETILDPTVMTGTCWGFKGGNGTVVVRLSQPIIVTEVSIDHINSLIAHHIDSAVKEFQIIGLKNTSDSGTDLGRFEYQININRHVQTFKVNNPNNETFSHVVLNILSNHGHFYTTIYRFRVHGYPDPNFKPSSPSSLSKDDVIPSNNNNDLSLETKTFESDTL